MTKKQLVIDYIKDQIKEGNLKPGKRILSEEDLSLKLGVSRNTLRLAFNVLEQEGFIERHHGSGTYIKKKNQDKKYILVLSASYSTKGGIRSLYRFYFKILNRYIFEKGYEPKYYIRDDVKKVKNPISDIENDIAGVISFGAYDKDLQYFINTKIPIINTLSLVPSILPNVTIDYLTLYYEVERIIKEAKAKDVLIFSLYRHKETIGQNYFHFPFNIEHSYFSKYNLKIINFLAKDNDGEGEIIEALNSITEKPDMIVFFDDNLFKIASFYFEDYPHIFKDTPIVTQSNVTYNYRGDYDITRLEFDFYEVGRATVNLLDDVIHNRPTPKTTIMIKPHIKTRDDD